MQLDEKGFEAAKKCAKAHGASVQAAVGILFSYLETTNPEQPDTLVELLELALAGVQDVTPSKWDGGDDKKGIPDQQKTSDALHKAIAIVKSTSERLQNNQSVEANVQPLNISAGLCEKTEENRTDEPTTPKDWKETVYGSDSMQPVGPDAVNVGIKERFNEFERGLVEILASWLPGGNSKIRAKNILSCLRTIATITPKE